MKSKPRKTVRSETREAPPLSLRAVVEPSTLDEEKRTVELVWTTGARVLRGLWEPFFEELSLDPAHVRMDRLNDKAPLLDSHWGYDNSGVIGVVESARLEKKRGVAKVRFASAGVDPIADAIFRKVKDGIITNVSVGYRIHKLEKVESGEGKTPVYRATDWEPFEISMVPIGADAGAKARDAGRHLNPCEVLHEERDMDEKQNEKPETENQKRSEPAADVDKAKAEADKAVKAERERGAVIRACARKLDLGDEFAEEHVEKGTTAEAFRALAIDEVAKRAEAGPVGQLKPGGASVLPGEDARDKVIRGASAWLFQKAGVVALVAEDAKKRGETLALDPGEFRGLSLLEMARGSLERAGVKTAGLSKDDIVGQALGISKRAGGMATISDFPVILENVLHKTLLAAYATVPDTWRQFCAVGSVSDFRAHTRYRQGTFGKLDKVLEHGEFQNKSIPDASKESITASTFGNIIGITRQALINDDMGAFSSLASRLGRGAGLSVEMDVYALLALNAGLGPNMNDGNTLFHATHNNISTGAALTAAAIDADRVVMASQKDPSANEILDLRPHVLVLPIGLGSLAKSINTAVYDWEQSSKFQKPNTVLGLFASIVDTPRMTGTRRYLFANPAQNPVIEVAFLDGQQSPFMQMQEGFRIDGVEWKVRLDYAVGAVDFRGAVTNAGV